MKEKLRYVPRALRLVWVAARAWTVIWAVLLVVQSILPVLTVTFTKQSVDSVVALVETGWDSSQLNTAIVPVVGLLAVQFFGRILNSIAGYVRTVQAEKVRDHIAEQIHVQALRLDLSYFEQESFYNLLYRANYEARERPLILLENGGMIIRAVLSTAGMAALLIGYGVWLLPVLVLSALPAFYAVYRYSQRLNAWRKENTPRERRSMYYDRLIAEPGAAAETRLFNLGEHYRSVFAQLRSELRTGRLRLAQGKVWTDILVTIIGLGVTGAVMAWMGLRVIAGTARLGDFAGLYQIFTTVQEAFSTISGRAGELYQSMLFLEDLFVFFDLKPRLQGDGTRTAAPLREAVPFENVTFRYPGSERDALKDFSMTIPAGKIVALVGENGEGKTSLMKLLCHFYDPTVGRVTWDGVDVREFEEVSLRRQITMLFQNPYYYPETVAMNIAISDFTVEPEMAKIEKAARIAAADTIIPKLPQGYQTRLGKWFGGEELSGGQWQRLALARAFFREASLIILDEPTSAMDAWAETDWLSRIRDAAEGRTMIMITHRFTTAMQADLICVIKDQRIIEQGSHAELLALGGRYAQSWHQQMRERENAPADALD